MSPTKILLLVLAIAGLAIAQAPNWQLALETLTGLTSHNVEMAPATHMGKRAVRLTEKPGYQGEASALVAGATLEDGTIEVDVAGRPKEGGAFQGARGFVGVGFRVRPDASTYEAFYIRPTNGRADDQLRRNHSTQYISHPEFTWNRLRQESPGVYESYVDLESGVWTHLKVEFAGKHAALYVNHASQPCLIVNDLKLAPAAGGVSLWIGDGTEAFFRDLKVTKTK